MKQGKLSIILAALLVVCIAGAVYLNGSQAKTITSLQESESQLKAQAQELETKLNDQETKMAELDTQKQSLEDEVAKQKGVIENTQSLLEETEKSLDLEMSKQENWAMYIEPNKLLGDWVVVNHVENENDFDASEKPSKDFWLKGIKFSNEKAAFSLGEGAGGSQRWVDDHIFVDDTAMGLMIKEVAGSEFLFLEWKSGDYINNNNISYYVLKKAN